jgi:hypothetical protein
MILTVSTFSLQVPWVQDIVPFFKASTIASYCTMCPVNHQSAASRPTGAATLALAIKNSDNSAGIIHVRDLLLHELKPLKVVTRAQIARHAKATPAQTMQRNSGALKTETMREKKTSPNKTVILYAVRIRPYTPFSQCAERETYSLPSETVATMRMFCSPSGLTSLDIGHARFVERVGLFLTPVGRMKDDASVLDQFLSQRQSPAPHIVSCT